MKSIKPIVAAALALPLAAPAMAQFQSSFTSDGIYGIESLITSGGGHETLFAGDLNFRFRPTGYDSVARMGFFLGITGWGGTLPTEYALYLGLAFYNLFGGTLLVGAPRPGAYGYNDLPLPGGGVLLDANLGLWNYRYGIGTYESFFSNSLAYGVRYEHDYGETDYAASLSRLNWGGGYVNLFSLGARHDLGSTQVFGTLEHSWFMGGSVTNGSVGLRSQLMTGSDSLGPVEAGGAVFFADNSGVSSLGAQAFVTAHPTGRLGLTLSAISREGFGTYYGASGAYTFGNRVEVQAGVAASNAGGSSTIYNIGLYQRF